MANPIYGSGPLRSREGLISRPAASSDEIQLRIDPMHTDLEEEISGIHNKKKFRALEMKGVGQEIETEAKFQNGIISQLACNISMISK
ncbi:bet1-like protein At4g14600 isoform X3 [Phoenix dactylifera]|uniref:Bet1-like protein At4g14600 isoform X3 n=1 Tax=Phoenix dactylifera TaxID=42345 RepID=A0A8B8J1V9_PHODC|nr:bet1-like protein At4g14600 isoform X3 [Phoenix dactylifera]